MNPCNGLAPDHGEIEHWIEVGQPEASRLRKACGRARRVTVYAFGKSADTWWKLNGETLAALPRLQVWQLDWEQMQAAAALLDRTTQLSVSVVGGILYLDNGSTSTSVEPQLLTQND